MVRLKILLKVENSTPRVSSHLSRKIVEVGRRTMTVNERKEPKGSRNEKKASEKNVQAKPVS